MTTLKPYWIWDRSIFLKKYKIKNIDCATCADNIELNLKKLDFVKDVSINIASSLIYINTDDIEKVKKEIKKIEPDVEVFDKDDSYKEEIKPHNLKREIIKISIVLLFLVIGIIFKKRLSSTPWSITEYIVFLSAYFLSGWKVLRSAFKNIIRGKLFDEHFLMALATIGAIAINEMPEAVAVMVFYNIGEFFQDLALNRSKRSIRSLLEIRPDKANLKTDGKIEEVSPEKIRPGQYIIVKPGEKIPLDGEITEGNTFVDTSALTGESVPINVKTGDIVLSGMINNSGVITVRVIRYFEESSVSKILDLVENATSRKAKTEKFITKFARYYTPVIVFFATSIALIPPIFFPDQLFSDWLYRALVILVVSCPCALVISIPLGYFGGIGGAAKRGILVKGSKFLDTLTKIKTVVFDKTGTLTKGNFIVSEIVTTNGFSKEELLQYTAITESQSDHPIAKSINEAYGKKISPDAVKNIREISGHGIKATVKGREVIAGNDRLMHIENITHKICNVGSTVVHVAIDRKYAGYITIADSLKEDAKKAITQLKDSGIKNIVMLTGDNNSSAKYIADKLGLDSYISELLPEEKLKHLEKIMNDMDRNEKLAFIGDGINDAPVLARADVGIAMGAMGSDAAVETADIVLMDDSPLKVFEAIKVARKTKKIVWQNIIFALSVKLVFIIGGGMGIATMWEAVFGDIGVALIAILNSIRVLKK